MYESTGATLLYNCETAALGPVLAPRFIPLHEDAALHTWLAWWRARPHGWLLGTLANLLSGYATSYDVHGLLGAYQMHLLSSQAWSELLQGQHAGTLLDVGAGAGYVTEGARPLFERITCTETSAALRKRLAKRGFEVLSNDLTDTPIARSFDVVSCFNVLDRTARPVSLLRQLARQLTVGGRLLVSMPLPPAPHVHVRGGTVTACERLPCSASSWEGAARELSEQLFAHVLEPMQMRLERLCRLPYLSRGDRAAPLYVLDAALWVFQRS